MRTVMSPVAATDATTLGENERVGASALSTWFSAPATAAASSDSPFWNMTPSRTLMSHSVGETCSHPVASAGTRAPSKSRRASPSRHPTLVSTKVSSVSIAQPAVGPNAPAMTSLPPAAYAGPADATSAASNPVRTPRASFLVVWFMSSSTRCFVSFDRFGESDSGPGIRATRVDQALLDRGSAAATLLRRH